MGNLYDAFEISPVPAPGPDAVAPELFRGIYGMPMFVTIRTPDLADSAEFWIRGLGFFELFSIPARLVHLRRWAFQDVLLVPADGPLPGPCAVAPAMTVSFACVIGEVEEIAQACHAVRPGSAGRPQDTPWNTRDVEVLTPEDVRVVLTAARPMDSGSPEAQSLEQVGITAPKDRTAAGTRTMEE